MTEIDSMEESVNIPFPKNTVRLKFTAFDRKRVPTTLSISYFNPRTSATEPMVKENKVMTLHKGSTPIRLSIFSSFRTDMPKAMPSC